MHTFKKIKTWNKHDKCIQHFKTKHLNENKAKKKIKILNQEKVWV